MLISDELLNLNSIIVNELQGCNNFIFEEIKDYLKVKTKRLRPSLIFLTAKSLYLDITDNIYYIASAVELLHNATLIHDDIIDNSKIRRGNISLNYKIGNGLSVLAGDIILSSALKQLVKCNCFEIINIFTESLYRICEGEINQNCNIGKIPSIEEYIYKTECKTAELFKASLLSLFQIENLSNKEKIVKFAKNFGIAFQIKDDLLNIINPGKNEAYYSDIKSGIYTAPVIYLNEDKKIENLEKENIIKMVQEEKYINKTKNLIKKYIEQAIEAIEFIEDNKYKKEIIAIAENLYKAGINE